MKLNQQGILKALSGIKDPDLGKDIVKLGFIGNPRVDVDRAAGVGECFFERFSAVLDRFSIGETLCASITGESEGPFPK
ncbi:MAG: DUF59 domain-containing protein [Acidobacteria bacterium]|nr:DUF59 domain-containing protein [Acidobacteriota bacterium]